MAAINYVILICILMIGKDTAARKRLKIVNGEDAQPGEIPYIVSLRRARTLSHFGSGSIFNKRYVITAGHCVYNKSEASIRVAVGSIYLNKLSSIHNVTRIYLHHLFRVPTHVTYNANDIALIKVDPPFEFDYDVSAVVLPRYHQTLPIVGSKVLVSGWGNMKGRELSVPNTLKKLEVTVVSERYCNNLYSSFGKSILSGQFCAHDIESNIRKGVCIGDSGGPLTINNSVLVGIVSWSIKDPDCASPLYPDVHTKVVNYVNWIHIHAV